MNNIEREKRVAAQMIRLYCRFKEGNRELCEECQALTAYLQERLDRCPFGEQKRSCRSCQVHCFKPAMRMKIRAVMRYSGPRLLWFHPMGAIRHLLMG